MVGPSLWAAPVSPDRWFSAESLERSRAYHRPLTTAALLRTAGRACGLVVVWLLAMAYVDDESARRPVAALAVGAAIAASSWFPGVVVDTWMEYRHEPRFGSTPLPIVRFTTVVLMGGVLTVALGAAAAVALRSVVGLTVWWPAITWVAVVAVVVFAGPGLARGFHRGEPLDPQVATEFATIARSGGVSAIEWQRLTSATESGLNAMTLGVFGRPVVLCTPELLAADDDLRDFVVAHEVAHVRRRHHRQALFTSAVGMAVEVAALWLMHRASLDRFDTGLLDARSLPPAMAVLAAVALPVGFVEAWQSRANERRADLDAIANLGSPGAVVLRVLHQHDRSDLDPGRLARLASGHPTPAERLRAAERATRAR